MMGFITAIFDAARTLLPRFRSDARGNVAIIFAFTSVVLLVATGSGIDLSRAFYARQKLSQVATLTCQFATRPSAVNTGATVNYVAVVNQYASNALASQNWPTTSLPTGANGTSGTYFTATGAYAGNTSQEPTGVTELSYNVPTYFLQIIHVNQITVHAVMNCQPPVKQIPNKPNAVLVQEGFETGQSSYYFTLPNGQTGTQPTASQTFPATAGYQGDHGNSFYIMGYCLEIDQAGVISPTDPEGNHSAELDCDNGSGSAGNSSISTKTYMPAGYYELRYNYRSRVTYANYEPAYICGSTASDVSWANDSGTGFNGQRTNQINVYLDQSVGNGPPPTHQTIGQQVLAGANLIDMCVYGSSWIDRSVTIKITTAGNYWLSFAADGNNDSYGGQLDNIRLCVQQCTNYQNETLDNFPAAWLPANNNGFNKVLFEDGFESPTYTTDAYASSPHSKEGNLNVSLGTTVTSSCSNGFGTYPALPGWTCQYPNGWSTAPYNEIVYFLQGAYQGSQYITLDGSNIYSTGSQSTNRLISRPFLLVPGYYQVSYNYISDVDFSATAGLSFTYCYAAPSSGSIFPTSYSAITGQNRYQNGTSMSDGSTNILGVFMSHGQLVSTPVVAGAPWSVGSNVNAPSPSLGATTSYTNPDGSVTTTPIVPPDSVTWPNYNASVSNPVLDVCGYAASFQWIPRSVSIKITKTAVYWLTFSANGGLADGNGPGMDDVKLTALGSPYMQSPPTSPLVSIPVPAPAPDSIYTGPSSAPFNGFSIIADPFMPPAAQP